MKSSFAAWADPHFVFRMPDETPFGIDQSLHGRPIIDYQVSCQDSDLDVSHVAWADVNII